MRKAATSSGEGTWNSPIKASTTLAAYATAFAAELDLVEHGLIRLQETFAAHSCNGPEDASTVNLATLDFACQVILALGYVTVSQRARPHPYMHTALLRLLNSLVRTPRA